MKSEELLRIFDIEELEEFKDFEQFAILMEDVENIDEDVFYEVLDGVEPLVIADMMESYFEDIKQGVPDESMEIYGAIMTASSSFQNRVKQAETHSDKMTFVDELYRFRQWYTEEGMVHCKDLAIGEETDISVCEALMHHRVEKLSEGKFEYDFSPCDEFVTEEYLVDEYIDEDEEDVYDEEDEYTEGLINRDNPAIDGEDYEAEDEENEEDYE